MTLGSFDDLLSAARGQPQAQRLLFVFAGASLPDQADATQRERFAAGEGGSLVPLMCVDKAPDEMAGFAALAEESRQFGQDWALVFVAALDAAAGKDVDAALRDMVQAIGNGTFARYAAFDREGNPVRFE